MRSWCKPNRQKELAVAADKQVTVAVDSNLTPELRLEGLAREVVRRIQAMRKDAGFDISDRIITYYQVSGEFVQVFLEWADYIKSETLTTQLIDGEPPSDVYTESQKVEGSQIKLGLMRKI